MVTLPGNMFSDDYFATLKFDNIRNAHLRFSLLNIMLGDSVIYVFHTI